MKKNSKVLDDRYIRGLLQQGIKAEPWDGEEPCPAPDLLAGYFNGELSRRMRRRIEDHVILCHACMKALDALQKTGPDEIEGEETPRNWSAIEKAMDKRFYGLMQKVPADSGRRISGEGRKTSPKWMEEIRRIVSDVMLHPRRLVIAGSLAVVALVNIYAFAYIGRDRYFQYARVKPEELPRMRTETAESAFNEGLRLYERKRYGKAIVRLSAAVNANPDQYAPQYYLGLSYLGAAESGLPGLPYKFRESDVNKGIGRLEKALVLSEGNFYYKADCSWYLGKACLMIHDVEKARAHFIRIVELNGPDSFRRDQALKMLSELR
jgi:tetratricopeptide (TPR) repeat protein